VKKRAHYFQDVPVQLRVLVKLRGGGGGMEGLGRRCFMGCRFFTAFSLCEFYPAGRGGEGKGKGDDRG